LPNYRHLTKCRLLDTLERGLLSLEEAAHRIKELRAERAALLKKKIALEKKSRASATVRLIPTALMNGYVQALQKRLREKKLGAKKEFIREIVKEVRIRDKTVQMTYKLPLVPRTSPSQGKISREGEFSTLCNLVMAYVYPPKMRATRDLLRRRMYLMRKRAELLAHVQNTNSQYNLPEIGKKIAYKANRQGVTERFCDPSVQRSIEVDLKLMDHYDQLLTDLELYIVRTAKQHDAHAFYRLRSVPGIGKILALVILYEIHDINRFATVQDFVSYARLVKCAKESAGKRHGTSGKKIGNVHLK
jgi:hypothetical protein